MTVQYWPKLSLWALIPRIRISKHIGVCDVTRKAESAPGRSASLHITEKTVGISDNRGLVVKETFTMLLLGFDPGSKYIRT